jgi:hypothetical protein
MNYRGQVSLRDRARNSFLRRKERILRWKKDRGLKKLTEGLHFEQEEALLIFSEARGGSTWLMELLSQLPGAYTIWEPLHPKRGIIPEGFHFCQNPLLELDEDRQEYLEFFKAMFSFELSNSWTRRFLDKEMIQSAEFPLVKFVRANLLLPWIMEHFEFKRKPVVLSRHPLDTCISQIKSFPPTDWTQIPDCANNERYVEHRSILIDSEDELEGKMVHWCLNNLPIYKWLDRQEEIIWVEYTDLFLRPEQEVRRIYQELGFGSDSDELIAKSNLNKRSFTSLNSRSIEKSDKHLHRNFRNLDSHKKARLQGILDHFGFSHYNLESPYPQR